MINRITAAFDARMAELCRHVADRLPAMLIRRADGRPYLVRHLVCRLPGGRRIYLHHFLASDDADVVHDHPCRFVSLLLSGAYTEERLLHLRDINQPIIRPHSFGRLMVNHIPRHRWHRVVLRTPSVWSLVWRGRTRKQWTLRRILWRAAAEGRWPYQDRPMSPGSDTDWRQCPTGRQIRRQIEAERRHGRPARDT